MGQIILLPATTAAYPDAAADLDTAECVLLLAARWWVVDHRNGEDPLPRLCLAMDRAGAHDAAYAVDRLMSVVARSARRPITVHCPRCPGVSDDEKRLLNAASLAQCGRTDLAERALGAAMLAAHGAEFAIGPLEGLGELFAAADLVFRRRPPTLPDRTGSRVVDAWTPPMTSGSVH